MSRPTRETAAGRAYLDLQNRARRERRGTQELLTIYVVERWLARLSRSPYANDFILKGGMLLAAFGSRRPTVDADALARNMAADQETVRQRVTEIASIDDPDDGVEYLTGTAATAVIRDDALYSGVRVTMTAQIATAQVKLRLDINFGDPVTLGPQMIKPACTAPGRRGDPRSRLSDRDGASREASNGDRTRSGQHPRAGLRGHLRAHRNTNPRLRLRARGPGCHRRIPRDKHPAAL